MLVSLGMAFSIALFFVIAAAIFSISNFIVNRLQLRVRILAAESGLL